MQICVLFCFFYGNIQQAILVDGPYNAGVVGPYNASSFLVPLKTLLPSNGGQLLWFIGYPLSLHIKDSHENIFSFTHSTFFV